MCRLWRIPDLLLCDLDLRCLESFAYAVVASWHSVVALCECES